uniref:Transposase n=1 Tax=blood disease bacterium R229 TaxID=741978 RepID=G2ZTT6_9RALS|nr:conserved hypothetical protein (modular protein) [blood disease bacterium R229]
MWDSVRLSSREKAHLLELSVLGMSVYRQRFDTSVSAKSRERFYRLIRACMAQQEQLREPFAVALECDQTTFGGARHGKRDTARGSATTEPPRTAVTPRRHGASTWANVCSGVLWIDPCTPTGSRSNWETGCPRPFRMSAYACKKSLVWCNGMWNSPRLGSKKVM